MTNTEAQPTLSWCPRDSFWAEANKPPGATRILECSAPPDPSVRRQRRGYTKEHRHWDTVTVAIVRWPQGEPSAWATGGDWKSRRWEWNFQCGQFMEIMLALSLPSQMALHWVQTSLNLFSQLKRCYHQSAYHVRFSWESELALEWPWECTLQTSNYWELTWPRAQLLISETRNTFALRQHYKWAAPNARHGRDSKVDRSLGDNGTPLMIPIHSLSSLLHLVRFASQSGGSLNPLQPPDHLFPYVKFCVAFASPSCGLPCITTEAGHLGELHFPAFLATKVTKVHHWKVHPLLLLAVVMPYQIIVNTN